MLVGGSGVRFPELHFDNYHMDVFVTQVCGDKEFIVLSPEQTEFVYQDPKYHTKSQISDIENPDLDRFPLFANAKIARVLVAEGETIYVPSGWWHTTKISEFSVAVSMNTINAFNWAAFCADHCTAKNVPNPIRRFAKRAYFKAGGAYLTMTEFLQLRALDTNA